MKKHVKKNQRGFTLIELVLVIAILGVLAVAALPRLFGVSLDAARTNAMKATAAAVQTGLTLYAAKQLAAGSAVSYPLTTGTGLDGVTGTSGGTLATGLAPFFTEVLQSGVTAQWLKISNTCYVFDNDGSNAVNAGDIYFEYTAGTSGTFLQVATCS